MSEQDSNKLTPLEKTYLASKLLAAGLWDEYQWAVAAGDRTEVERILDELVRQNDAADGA